MSPQYNYYIYNNCSGGKFFCSQVTHVNSLLYLRRGTCEFFLEERVNFF